MAGLIPGDGPGREGIINAGSGRITASETLMNVPRAWLDMSLTRRGDPCKFGLSSTNIIAAPTTAKTKSQAVPILQVVDGVLV